MGNIGRLLGLADIFLVGVQSLRSTILWAGNFDAPASLLLDIAL